MRGWHWLHVRGTGETRLAAYAAGELTPAEQLRVEAGMARCVHCRQTVQSYRAMRVALRATPRAVLSAEESAGFVAGVHRRIRQGHAAGLHPARASLRELLWDHPRLSLASAVTAAILVAGLTLSQLQLWGTSGRNGVEIISVDVDENAPVMVFEAPGTALKIIWVFEEAPSS